MVDLVKVKILRTVPVSEDGITTRQVIAGTEDTVPADALAGLKAEGYVALIEEKVEAPTPKAKVRGAA